MTVFFIGAGPGDPDLITLRAGLHVVMPFPCGSEFIRESEFHAPNVQVPGRFFANEFAPTEIVPAPSADVQE